MWKYCQEKNNPKLFQNRDGFIISLITHCEDEKMVGIILKNIKNFNTYINTKVKLNSSLKNTLCQTIDDKNKILVNLTLMNLFNKTSFKNLWQSEGVKEILKRELNLSYLKDIKPSDKIDENFFYELFENVENSTNERLTKAGIDVVAANKFIQLADEEICKNPKVLDDLL